MSFAYTTPPVITQRKALVLALLRAEDEDRGRSIAATICGRLGAKPYSLAEEGYAYATEWHADADSALAAAEAEVDRAAYDDPAADSGTIYVGVEVTSLIDRADNAYGTVELEAEEPACEEGHDHDWQSPIELVGGCAENPGVFGHGGGVVIKEVCAHCGIYRRTDTWAQHPDTGEQGLHSVSYEPADDASAEWLDSGKAEA